MLQSISTLKHYVRNSWSELRRTSPSQIQFWFLALMVGIGGGLAALGFRLAIDGVQTWVYGTEDVNQLHSFVAGLPWYLVLITPVCGGLIVGVILHHFTKDGRVRSVADVIEGAALRDGRVEGREGLASALASLITLSTGGSTGREGPVVHLAGVISSKVSKLIKADGITGRDLLGCAVAAAVAASFNAPIAGALFALEVILRHFAVHAFAPIVIASVAGALVARARFGDITEFTIPGDPILGFYLELPAFLILGLLCGLVAVVLMRLVFWAESGANHMQAWSGVPRWLRPAIAGAFLGVIAIGFPHIIGVGYETTLRALSGDLLWHTAVVFCVIKMVAVAITMAGRMGGGIFSPALMVGALTGLAFGVVATGIFPEVSGHVSLYALAGMGAVAAAVLGAPISTTLIVFELTGDWQTGLAVMVAVSMSTALASNMVDRSFFLTQLERRDIHLAAGPQAYLLATFGVAQIMRRMDHPDAAPEAICWQKIQDGIYLTSTGTLEDAMPLFQESNVVFVPIVSFGKEGTPNLQGALFQVDALRAYNRALAATAAEEHS